MVKVTRLALVLAVVSLLNAVPGPGARSAFRTQTAGFRTWHATLRYGPGYGPITLKVRHGNATVVSRRIRLPGLGGGAEPGRLGNVRGPLAFAFLDGQRAPQLLVALYTGGAHCCTVLEVLDFNAPRPHTTALDLGNVGAEIRWLAGHPSFLTADDRFAYAFTSFAGSGLPLRIWRYDHGRILDVTSRFPSRVAADAGVWWRLTADPHGVDRRGFAAAWAADEALLGRSESAHAELERLVARGKLRGPAGWKSGQAYVEALWRFLARSGYLTG